MKITIKPDVRNFRIIVGLREGYAVENRLHKLFEAQNIYNRWLRDMQDRGRPHLPAISWGATAQHLRRKDMAVTKEPVAVFEGDITDATISTMDASDAFDFLVKMLAEELKQVRIRVILDDTCYLYDRS